MHPFAPCARTDADASTYEITNIAFRGRNSRLLNSEECGDFMRCVRVIDLQAKVHCNRHLGVIGRSSVE